MAVWIKMPIGREVGLGPSDTALDGDPVPPPKKGAEPPQFSAHVYCSQTAGWIKMALGMEVGLGPAHIVLDGHPALPLQKRGTAPPQFSAHVYCGQTARWIKMSLGSKLGLGPGHTVLHGDPAPPKVAQPPTFPPMFTVAKRSPISATTEHLYGHVNGQWISRVAEKDNGRMKGD